jgi:RNA polymerase sigma factor (sigma-70 family)
VARGTTVSWINHDDVPHTVVSKDQKFRPKTLDTNDQFTFTFALPGIMTETRGPDCFGACETWRTLFSKNRPIELAKELNKTLHAASRDAEPDPETLLLKSAQNRILQEALDELPVGCREALILRELQELSFKEIVEPMEIPVGSMMSALARGRGQLRCRILRARQKEVQHGLRG